MLGGIDMARTARLSVMLDEDIKTKLKTMAAGMGMTESALSAYIIGQWVFTQIAVNGKVLNLLDGPEMKQIINSAISEGVRAERT